MSESPTNKLVKFLALFCGSGILLLLLFPLTTTAAFTKQINYQGKLTNASGAAVANGSYSIVFKLYDDPSAGSNVWTETQSVTVTSGLFSTMLGSVTSLDALNFNQPLYLSINVNGDGEMAPRKTFGSVPNAFNTLTFDGFATSSFLRSDIANATGTISNFTSDSITLNGVTRTTWPGGGSGTDVNWSYNPLTDTLSPATSTSNTLVLGKMGIGAITPGFADFQINVNRNSNLNGIDIGNLSAGNVATAEVKMFNDLGQTGALFSTGSNYNLLPGIANNSFGLVSIPGHDLSLAAAGNDSINFLTNASTSGLVSMTIKGTNVGIGTTTPEAKLTISGASTSPLFYATDSNDPLSFLNAYYDSFDTPSGLFSGISLKSGSNFLGNQISTMSMKDGIVLTPSGDASLFDAIGSPNTVGLFFGDNILSTTSAISFNYSSGDFSFTNKRNFSFTSDDPNAYLSVGTDLIVAGNATTSGYLNIGNSLPSGANLASGNLNVQSNLIVGGNATTSNLFVSNNFSAGGNITTGSSLVVGSGLDVGGNATTSGLFVFNDLKIGGNATTAGSFVVSNNLSVGGLLSLNGLSVNGNVSALGYLNLGSVLPFGSDPTNGSLNIQNNFAMGGNAILGSSTVSSNIVDVTPNILLPTSFGGNIAEKIVGNYLYMVFQMSTPNDILRIIDITDPDHPKVVGGATLAITGMSGGARGFDVAGKYAYIGSEASGKIVVVDISNPSNPTIAGSYLNSNTSLSIRGLKVVGKYAYIALYPAGGNDGFQILDISNPSNIRRVSNPVSGLISELRSVEVSGRYAYVTSYSDAASSTFRIIDISDPVNPVQVGGQTLNVGGWGRKVVVRDRYAYLINDAFGLPTDNGNAANEAFKIIDISDPTNPQVVGGQNLSFDYTNTSGINDIIVDDHYAYVTDRPGANFKIIDISSSTNPTFAYSSPSYRATNGEPWPIAISRGRIYTGWSGLGVSSATSTALKVFKIGNLYTPSLTTGSLYTSNLNLEGDLVSQGLIKAYSLNLGWGGIMSEGALSISSTNTSSYLGGSLLVGTSTSSGNGEKLTVAGNGLFQLTATSSLTISNINSGGSGGVDFPLLTGHAYTQNVTGVDLNILGVADRMAIVEQDSLADPFLGFYDKNLTMLAQLSVATTTNQATFGSANGWSFNTSSGSSTLSIDTANNTVYVDKLVTNGAVYSNNNILTSVNPSSRAYKNNILDTSLNIDALLGLQVKSFNWNNNGQSDFGLIAEEIQSALPELYMDDGVTRGYRADHLPFYLLQIAQRQAKQIIELDNRIASGTIAIASSTETLSVEAIQALSGNWSIGADGTLTVKSIKADNAIIENGVTVRDRATGSYSCIYVSNGTIQTSTGECSTVVVSPGTGSDGGDTGTTTPGADLLGDKGTSSPAIDPVSSSSEPVSEPAVETPAPAPEPETPTPDPALTE